MANKRTGYFKYLCEMIDAGGQHGRSYIHLAKYLMHREFVSIVAGDKNREYDGVKLRDGFSDAPDGQCSVLEMLAGLCGRMIFMAEGIILEEDNTEPEWFGIMISNLGLSSLDDIFYEKRYDEFFQIADDRVDRWLNREYDYNGFGGLFPLDHAKTDQVQCEIWYQMNSYLMERMDDI